MTDKMRSIVSTLIISLFVFLFTYTGLSKIFQHDLFLFTLKQSPLLKPFAGLISWSLPVFELCTAFLLIIKKTQRIAIYITLALLSIFTLCILYLLVFVSHLPCSCGGVLQSLSWNGHLILNLFLVFLSLFEILLIQMPIYKQAIRAY